VHGNLGGGAAAPSREQRGPGWPGVTGVGSTTLETRVEGECLVNLRTALRKFNDSKAAL